MEGVLRSESKGWWPEQRCEEEGGMDLTLLQRMSTLSISLTEWLLSHL